MFRSHWVVNQFGGPDAMEWVREPLRSPFAGEVRIKIQAAGVALGDVLRRAGKYPASLTLPYTPGYDAVGVVEEAGAVMKHFHPGQQVGVFFNGAGGYSTHVYAKADEVFPIPEAVDPLLAAAVILNYVSAYQMLHRLACATKGERILIHGASGGVGTALLELGKLAGLQMYGTASEVKHAVVTSYGAIPIDYRSQDFVNVLREQVPEGMDIVLDPIGGDNYRRSMQTLSVKGRFIGYGYTSILQAGESEDWASAWKRLAEQQATENGNPISLYSITGMKQEQPDWFREDVAAVLDLLARGEIKPLVSRILPLEDAIQAHEMLETSRNAGKIVLVHA
ncbi:zinc-binding dehydrogenase [Paenibacillus rhizovicinus]|uniref:Zinc-binding dehydrogenase n=1 Tax=Paenibacillus rhizovicinus TaxID=2704463 RepID=A0A6C0P835_9BACL|nr:medium chain dehydrogenase/reductase family protein [Paenibacillus rhizovicinus]QHW33793.1 zinc-binding dehydrogenase [Paenibacillus rhizovicinus]